MWTYIQENIPVTKFLTINITLRKEYKYSIIVFSQSIYSQKFRDGYVFLNISSHEFDLILWFINRVMLFLWIFNSHSDVFAQSSVTPKNDINTEIYDQMITNVFILFW